MNSSKVVQDFYTDLLGTIKRHVLDDEVRVVIIDTFETCVDLLTDMEAPYFSYIDSLKTLCKDLNCCIYLKVNSPPTYSDTAPYRPQFQLLRKAGLMFHWFDQVITVYEPGYLGIMEWEDGTDTHWEIEIAITDSKTENWIVERFKLPRN